MKDLSKKTVRSLRMRKPKVIKIENGITYLESDYDENKTKRKVSLETRKKLSESRRKATKQPREGQSKKANNFFKQLEKDYIKFSSARGKFQESKDKEYEHLLELNEDWNNDLIGIVDEDESEEIEKIDLQVKEIKKRGKFSKQEKETTKNWIISNKDRLSKITANDGIISEYEIQKLNFTEVKMEESLLINVEENIKDFELKTTHATNKNYELMIEQQFDEELTIKELNEIIYYFYSKGINYGEIIEYLIFNRIKDIYNNYETSINIDLKRKIFKKLDTIKKIFNSSKIVDSLILKDHLILKVLNILSLAVIYQSNINIFSDKELIDDSIAEILDEQIIDPIERKLLEGVINRI